jgi:hypothetical protein
MEIEVKDPSVPSRHSLPAPASAHADRSQSDPTLSPSLASAHKSRVAAPKAATRVCNLGCAVAAPCSKFAADYFGGERRVQRALMHSSLGLQQLSEVTHASSV